MAQQPRQIHPRVAGLVGRERLGRAAAGATLRPHVDQPVGGFDHVEVVLDDDDGVADKVQAGGGFVEDVEGAPGVALAEFERELHALATVAFDFPPHFTGLTPPRRPRPKPTR